MMAETRFGVTYDGPGVAEGRMPVRDLAPALLALGDLFSEASRAVYPEQEPLALDIRATGEGSFNVLLAAHGPDLWDQIVKFFTSSDVTAIDVMKDFIIGGGGLFLWTKRLRGRRIKKQQQLESGDVRVTLDDGAMLEIPAEVLQLYQRTTIRKKMREVVRPVGKRGVKRLDFQSEGQTTVSVETGDVRAFELDEGLGEVVSETEGEKLLSILSVVFTEGNKWRFTDGDARFSAAIEDGAFVARVHQGEPFSEGDMLRCQIREVQTEQDGVLHTNRFITEVVQHLRGKPQLPLVSDDEPES